MHRAVFFPLLLAILVLLPSASASEGPPPLLNPTTYTSPSGEYSLYVNPSDQHGIGKGDCTLKRRGEVVWTKTLPYTFWEAAVTDDGRAAGYAYSHGFQGWGAGGQGFGDLIVALLNADGTEASRETTPRLAEGGWSCPPNRQPSPNGFFLQPTLNRFVVRLDAVQKDGEVVARGERWRSYALADGKRTGDQSLAAPPGDQHLWYRAVDTDPVPGTELTLVLWSRCAWRPNNASDEGCRLSLVDKEAKEVWSREWTTEFKGIQCFSPWILRERDITPEERFGDHSFVYLSNSQQAALTFKVTKDAKGAWSAEEVATKPEAVCVDRSRPPAAQPKPAPATSTLEHLGSFTLGGAQVSEALDIHDFAFDARSRCGFVPSRSDGAYELVRIDPAAVDPIKDAVRMPLQVGVGEKLRPPQAGWIGGDRWIIVQGSYTDGVAPSAWIADVAAGTLTPLEGFIGPTTGLSRGVVGGGEQGFAIIGDYRTSEIVRYDATGKRLWTQQLSTCHDAAFRADGTLGVLLGISNLIVEYDKKGTELRRIDVAAGFGSRPSYVTGLEADADGGWIVHDFGGKPPVVRLTAANEVAASFTPRFPDGRTFTLYGEVRRAPDGRIWTSDHAALLRLDDKGVVDRVIGPDPDTDTLDEVNAITVDHKGRIYALDGRTAKTHIFDKSGARVMVLRPEPTDFATSSGSGSITVSGDGSVYCRPNSLGMGDTRYLKFDGEGRRVGFQDGRSREVCDEWFFRPGGQELVVLGYERAFLYDASGKQVRTIERRADGLWLAHPDDAAVAPNGTFALIARGSHEARASVTIYSAAGDALTTHNLPNGGILSRVAACDSAVAVVDGGTLLWIDRASGKPAHFDISGKHNQRSWHVPFFSPDDKELWIIDMGERRVDRYKAPVP